MSLPTDTSAHVTVLIPSYNHAPYITEAIESVRRQTHTNWDMCVLDDGSTDATWDILSQFASQDDRIKIFHQSNAGAPTTLNRLLGMARGPYIAILNSDDAYEPDRFRLLIEACRSREWRFVCTAVQLIDAAGKPHDCRHPWLTQYRRMLTTVRRDGLVQGLLFGNFTISTSNFFFHRSLLDEGLTFGHWTYHHDWSFAWAALQALGREFGFLDQIPALRYRFHDSNTITSKPLKVRLELLRLQLGMAKTLGPQADALSYRIRANLRSLRREHQSLWMQRLFEAQAAEKSDWLRQIKAAHTERDETAAAHAELRAQHEALKQAWLVSETQVQQLQTQLSALEKSGWYQGYKLSRRLFRITMQLLQLCRRVTRLFTQPQSRRTFQSLSANAWRQNGWRGLVNLYSDHLHRQSSAATTAVSGANMAGPSANAVSSQQTINPYADIRASQSPHPRWHVTKAQAQQVQCPSDLRVIAYYLPQFHPFEVNNQAWGQGFTEWTNVTKGLPQFKGHYQPHLPADLGFYDLRLPETMRAQIDMAKQHGIDGFCFYYYWFDGRRVMEKPLDMLMADPSLDMPFCICWANENWTKKWDGLDHEIVLGQNYSREACESFIDDVIPVLRDKRYILVRGLPLLMIYRPSLIPDIAQVVARWRQRALDAGLPGLWMVNAQTFGVIEPDVMGFDAAAEFPPHKINQRIDHIQAPPLYYPGYQGRVWDYAEAVSEAKTSQRTPYPLYRAIFPSWDNEARRPGAGYTFANANPLDFSEWLSTSASYLRQTLPVDERLLFINAWNEWAEGAHLEPDRHFGYAWLDQVARLKNRTAQAPAPTYAVGMAQQRSQHRVAVLVHAYYTETWGDIAQAIQRMGQAIDLWVTTAPDKLAEVQKLVLTDFPAARIHSIDNVGRDIRPFMAVLPALTQAGYSAVLKLHTKKSLHRVDGDVWRQQLLTALVPSAEGVEENLRALERYPSLGVIAPAQNLLNLHRYIGSNQTWCERLVQEWGDAGAAWLDHMQPWFPAGSMFWFKPAACQALLACASIQEDAFEPEQGQIDGTLAHAVERVLGAAALALGYHTVDTDLAQKLGSTKASTQRDAERQWQAQWGRHGRLRVQDSPFARPTSAQTVN